MMSFITDCDKSGAVQWLCGSRHKISPLLWPPSQTPQVICDPLAAPGSNCLWTHPALWAAAPGGWVEVSARLLTLEYMSRTCIFHITVFITVDLNYSYPHESPELGKLSPVFVCLDMTWGSDTSHQISWRNSKMTEPLCSTFTCRSVMCACGCQF